MKTKIILYKDARESVWPLNGTAVRCRDLCIIKKKEKEKKGRKKRIENKIGLGENVARTIIHSSE